jgi:hypothetical protein
MHQRTSEHNSEKYSTGSSHTGSYNRGIPNTQTPRPAQDYRPMTPNPHNPSKAYREPRFSHQTTGTQNPSSRNKISDDRPFGSTPDRIPNADQRPPYQSSYSTLGAPTLKTDTNYSTQQTYPSRTTPYQGLTKTSTEKYIPTYNPSMNTDQYIPRTYPTKSQKEFKNHT